MKTQSPDTSWEAEQVQIELLRKAGSTRRAQMALNLSETVMAMSLRAIRRRHPEWNEQQVGIAFVELHYGSELAASLKEYLEPKS